MAFKMTFRIPASEFLPLKEQILGVFFIGNPTLTRHKSDGAFEYATFESDVKDDVDRVYEMLPRSTTISHKCLPLWSWG